MYKLIVFTAISIIVVTGKTCINKSDNYKDDSSHQYKKLTCTVCNALQQFTTVSSMLTNELTTLRHVDGKFTLDLNVRLIHIHCYYVYES